MTNDDHPPDTDDDDITDDPDAMALIERVAEVLINAAHDFAEAAGSNPSAHPPWSALGTLERNLAMAGVIALARRHRTLLDELRAIRGHRD